MLSNNLVFLVVLLLISIVQSNPYVEEVVPSHFLNITANIPHSYNGTSTMYFHLRTGTREIELVTNSMYEVFAARAKPSNHYDVRLLLTEPPWETLSVEVVKPARSRTILKWQDETGSKVVPGLESMYYTIEVELKGRFTEEKKGFYVSKNTEDNTYYAITGFAGGNEEYFFPHYDTNMNMRFFASVEKKSSYVVLTCEDSGCCNDKGVIPIAAYGLFIGNFHEKNTSDWYHVAVPRRNGRTIPDSFLVYKTGEFIVSNLNKFFIDESTTRLFTRTVILPNWEPNVIDSRSLLYFQGTSKIDGVPLRDLLLIDTISLDTGRSSFTVENRGISSNTIQKTLLYVAEKYINRCLGYKWWLIDAKQREKNYGAVVELVDFLKYEQTDKIYESQRSMDLMYIDYVQPYMWRSVYEYTYTLPNGDIPTNVTKGKFIATFRMFHDFLIHNELIVESDNVPEQLDEFLKYALETSTFNYILYSDPQEEYSKYIAKLNTKTQFDAFVASVFRDFRKNMASDVDVFTRVANQMNNKYNANSNFTHVDVGKWVVAENYPIVNVEWNEETGEIVLSQWQYGNIKQISFEEYYSGKEWLTDYELYWKIPMLVEYSPVNGGNDTMVENNAPKVVFRILSTENTSVSIGAGDQNWILLNPGQSVLYHVNYSAPLWFKLFGKLFEPNFGGIHYISRAQLLDDLIFLGMKGGLKVQWYTLLKYLVNENELVPWTVASRHLKFIYQRSRTSPYREKVHAFIKELVKPLFDKLGAEDNDMEHISMKKLRNIAIDLACMFGDENCIEQVKNIVQNLVKSNPYHDLPVNTRDAICCAALRTQSKKMEKLMPDKARNRGQPIEELEFYEQCMSCATSTDLLRTYVDLLVGLETERTHDLAIQDIFVENAAYDTRTLIATYLEKKNSEWGYFIQGISFIKFLYVAANQVQTSADEEFFRTSLNNKVEWFKHSNSWQTKLAEMEKVMRKMISVQIDFNTFTQAYFESDFHEVNVVQDSCPSK